MRMPIALSLTAGLVIVASVTAFTLVKCSEAYTEAVKAMVRSEAEQAHRARLELQIESLRLDLKRAEERWEALARDR